MVPSSIYKTFRRWNELGNVAQEICTLTIPLPLIEKKFGFLRDFLSRYLYICNLFVWLAADGRFSSFSFGGKKGRKTATMTYGRRGFNTHTHTQPQTNCLIQFKTLHRRHFFWTVTSQNLTGCFLPVCHSCQLSEATVISCVQKLNPCAPVFVAFQSHYL